MKLIHTLYFVVLLSSGITAQVSNESELFKSLKVNDSILFELGFNQCKIEATASLIDENLEFYHDQGGITMGKEPFLTSLKKNICGQTFKSRRELLKNTLEVYPLYDNGRLYGAIQKGVHQFYQTHPGKKEQLGSIAKFTHLWLKKDSGWIIKRVLSYDHKDPNMKDHSAEVSLNKEELKTFVGTYEAPNTGQVEITIEDNALLMNTKKSTFLIYPKSDLVFFHKQAPLEFKFVKDDNGQVTKFLVIENGNLAEEVIKK